MGQRQFKLKSQKKKLDENIEDVYLCHTCKAACEWDPAETENESIAYDKCNCWFHYKCAKWKGTEEFLKKADSTWLCTGCSWKGKGKSKASNQNLIIAYQTMSVIFTRGITDQYHFHCDLTDTVTAGLFILKS